MAKIIKVMEFKQQYEGKYQNPQYESLEEWQKKHPEIKVVDTKINQKVTTYYENLLLVTYEEEEK